MDKLTEAVQAIVNYVETKMRKKKTSDQVLQFLIILAAIAIVGILAATFSRKT